MARESGTTPKIQKVPNFLRGRDVSSFEPRIVSLGPIHGNRDYQRGLGYNCKKRLTSEFVKASGKELNVLCGPIKKIINQLKNCFDENVTRDYSDDDLAWLLCKDGCAILQYMYSATTHNMSDGIAQDILLLENQIPYKVLEELMKLSDKKRELKESIATFIERHVNQRDVQIDGDHVHLLDLVRTILLGNSQAETLNKGTDLPPLRNVQELNAAGIRLRRSSDRFLSNISFGRRFHLLGRLYLPPITVNYSAMPKFLNLVAYEMCLDLKNDPRPGVISYLFFLSSLIRDTEQDVKVHVKVLREAGILFINDTELQKLFRVLTKAGVWTYNHHVAYIGVKEDIQEYYGTLTSRMLKFYHANIRDRNWPLILIFAILLDLIFGGTQTWISVKNRLSDKIGFSVSPASQSHS